MDNRPSPSSVKMEVNLQSVDAMFATLLADGKHLKELLIERLDAQDKTLNEIKVQATKTNGRVSALEHFRDSIAAKVAGFVFAISLVGTLLVWIFQHVLKLFIG